jgi:UDP-N-acetylglucosamine--N-acetylmuramyl-(pentapeptide) pyrophosphoryl-undecaprenol N-acetylglucosamine transferase
MKRAFLVAGGTGGHINAALAVGEALSERGVQVQFLTGKRPLDYKLFRGQKVRHLDSKPLRTKNPIELLHNLLLNFASFVGIFLLFLRQRPAFVVGAGGYVCGPTLLAAYLQFIPVYIIEQNAVMGLTNRILGWISRRIFVHFTETRGLSPSLARKVSVVGNPTRKAIQSAEPRRREGPLRLLVFGGSLGATQINEVIFEVLKNPPVPELIVHHQLGGDQALPQISTSAQYVPMNYIDDIQQEYQWCDLIIARAGASTVSELAIIQKPVLLIPYPQATDNHQWFNAEIFRKESAFTVEVLNPRTSREDAVARVSAFLLAAEKGELRTGDGRLTRLPATDLILREILGHGQ